MKATINSFISSAVSLHISDVTSVGEVYVIRETDRYCYVFLTGACEISGDISLSIPYSINDIVNSNIKLMYKHNNTQTIVPISFTNLVSTLQPMQAGLSKELPSSINKIAACTICYNEEYIIKKWVAHYGSMLGYENLFIIDDGSDTPVSELFDGVPVNVIRSPRALFDSWRLVRTLGFMQRMLLETYDLVITCDSDEFIICNDDDPSVNVVSYLKSKSPNELINLAPIGFDLVYSKKREADLDETKTIFSQRKYVVRNKIYFDKPLISTEPTSFLAGLHNSYFPKKVDSKLLMIHVRMFDYNFAVNKLSRYKNTSWCEHDLKTGQAFHQRQKIEELDQSFEEIDRKIDLITSHKTLSQMVDGEAGVIDNNLLSKLFI